MSQFETHFTSTKWGSHSFSIEDAVAGLAHDLLGRFEVRKLPPHPCWLFSMSVPTDDVIDDSPQMRMTISEAQSGNRIAFSQLVEHYQSDIATQMRRFSRDKRICEELTHDVFVEAYFSLHNFRFHSPFLHWLRRIAVRVGYRHWKRQKQNANVVPLSELPMLELAARSTTESINPTDAADLVYYWLSRLPPSDRLVLTVVYLDGCSIREAAFRCCWTVTGTKLRLFRARRKMIALLKENDS